MNGPEPARKPRRTSRLALAISVEITGKDGDGAEFSEKATTQLVSKHGALVLLKHRLAEDSPVELYVPNLQRQQGCRVAWVGGQAEESGKYETGLEFVGAENFWEIQFPSGDWVIPKQAPLAGSSPGLFPLESYLGANDPEVLRDMLSALVSLLEEKGVLSRAELSDMLRRMHTGPK